MLTKLSRGLGVAAAFAMLTIFGATPTFAAKAAPAASTASVEAQQTKLRNAADKAIKSNAQEIKDAAEAGDTGKIEKILRAKGASGDFTVVTKKSARPIARKIRVTIKCKLIPPSCTITVYF
jgi:hypothetical protein